MAKPELARQLDLEPHPEGGWYRESWRSTVDFEPDGHDGSRASATAIYFLLAPGEESGSHRVRSAEIWLWHSGGPLTLQYDGITVTLDPDVAAGSAAASRRTARGVPVRPAGGQAVLVSCVGSPGFDFADFTLSPAGQLG